MFLEPIEGQLPHPVGQNVAGSFFNEVTELLRRAGALVRPRDCLDPFAGLLNGAAIVFLAQVQVQARGAIKAAMSGVSPYWKKPGMKFGKQCNRCMRWMAL